MPIASDVRVGARVTIHHPPLVNLYGCAIGDDTRIGTFVEIQKGATIGARCKVSSHTFVCEGVTIEDEVFVGHGVMFINDRYPRATADGRPQSEADWAVVPTLVKRGASIGSGVVVMCGLTIGEGRPDRREGGGHCGRPRPRSRLWSSRPACWRPAAVRRAAMIGLGVIGYGYWGPNLVRNLAEVPGAWLVKVADLRPERLALVRQRYPAVETTSDSGELVADPRVDAVAIATPVSTHFEFGMQALRAGKHVLIEKPLAATSEQALRLIEEADRRKRILMVDP
jgi:UDP-2-acetamido-3-amino-2,3-dideoxy-glucuronate N-acetyltransferase